MAEESDKFDSLLSAGTPSNEAATTHVAISSSREAPNLNSINVDVPIESSTSSTALLSIYPMSQMDRVLSSGSRNQMVRKKTGSRRNLPVDLDNATHSAESPAPGAGIDSTAIKDGRSSLFSINAYAYINICVCSIFLSCIKCI